LAVALAGICQGAHVNVLGRFRNLEGSSVTHDNGAQRAHVPKVLIELQEGVATSPVIVRSSVDQEQVSPL